MTNSETQAEPQKRKRGVWFYVNRGILVFLAYAVLRVVWFFSPLLFSSHPRVTVGEDTTYVLGPLDENGYVDYAAAINEIASEGVTRENNAAIPLLEVMGVDSDNPFDTEQHKVFKVLNATPLPVEQRYKRLDYFESRSPRPENIDVEEMNPGPLGDRGIAQSRPWTKKEFGVVYEWVTENDTAIDRIVEATRRPRFYVPLDFDEDNEPPPLSAALSPLLSGTREAARALTARAMLRVSKDNLDGARDDLMACHRLARLTCQRLSIIDWLVASVIEQMVNDASRSMIHYSAPDARWLATYRKQFNELPKLCRFADKLQIERLMALDWFSGLAQGRYTNVEPFPPWSAALDHDAILRFYNNLYDRLEYVSREDNYKERSAIFDEFGIQQERIDREMRSLWFWISQSLFATRRGISDLYAEIMVLITLPSINACLQAGDRNNISTSMTDAAIAMALFRINHGAYPKTLDELIPKYVDSIPFDNFADGPIRYRQEGAGYVMWSVGNDNENDEGDNDDTVIRMPIRDEDYR